MKLRSLTGLLIVCVINYSCKVAEKDYSMPEGKIVQEKKPYDLIVAKDGTGNYTTVQEAVDAVPRSAVNTFTILIKQGVYKEVIKVPADKPFIRFKGEGFEKTTLTYDNFAKRLNADGKEYGTSGSASVFINGNNFVAEDLTFENSAGMNAGHVLKNYYDPETRQGVENDYPYFASGALGLNLTF